MTSDNRSIVIIGAGGHAKVVIDVARSAGWICSALFDPSPSSAVVMGIPVEGDDAAAEEEIRKGNIRNAIVAIGNNRVRQRIGNHLRSLGCHMPTLVHTSAWVSSYATIGQGTVVMPGAVINASAQIGDDVIVNSQATVEHDCRLGDGCHVAPRSVMGGTCEVGERTLLGIGACVRPCTKIGSDVVVGGGSMVVSNIDRGQTVYGVPARTTMRPQS